MNKLILPIAILIFAFPVLAQKRRVRKPVPKPKIYTVAGVTNSVQNTPAAAQKVYVMKTDGSYLYGIFLGANGDSVTIKTDSVFTIKLSEIDKIIFKEGIATRISGTSETATNNTEREYRGTGKFEQTDSPERIAGGERTGTLRKITGGVLNGKAETLVKPEYPAAARAVRASGAVNIQVTIDERGTVISAAAVSGHPLLRQAAENAARASKFAPTLLEGQPVQITGLIVYNFVP